MSYTRALERFLHQHPPGSTPRTSLVELLKNGAFVVHPVGHVHRLYRGSIIVTPSDESNMREQLHDALYWRSGHPTRAPTRAEIAVYGLENY